MRAKAEPRAGPGQDSEVRKEEMVGGPGVPPQKFWTAGRVTCLQSRVKTGLI